MEEDEAEEVQEEASECEDPAESHDDCTGTRHFPRFDVQHPVFYRFEEYLTIVDGGDKSEKSAREISVDVSKYLRYACGPSCPSPDWADITLN